MPTRVRFDAWPCRHPHAAGMAIGARASVGAVPPARDAEPVRVCETCPPERPAWVDGRGTCHMNPGVMAATGVSGVPLVALREPRGLTPSRVNARHVKTVPGRQTAWPDAPWLQTRPALGWWPAAFRPAAERGVLRTRRRHRALVLAPRAPPMLYRQNPRPLMHRPWSEGLTESTGVTGPALWRASVAGERAPVQLAPWRTPAGTSSADTIAKARRGPWRDARLGRLQQALARFDDETQQIVACDAQSERPLAAMTPRVESDEPPPPWPRPKPGSTSQPTPRDDARADLMRRTGVDLGAVPGSSAASAQTIRAAIGTDMTQCPPVKPCCSGLGLAPHHDVSGGRVWRSRTLNVGNRATQACRQAAQSGARAPSAVGASCRSMRARLGPEHATVATAHQGARVVDHLRKERDAFPGTSAREYERERRERELKHRSRRAKTRGDTRIPVGTSHPAPAP